MSSPWNTGKFISHCYTIIESTIFSICRDQIVGRQVFDVKVCACPGRDAANVEKEKDVKPGGKYNCEPEKFGRSRLTFPVPMLYQIKLQNIV